MATLEDIRSVALRLPEVTEGVRWGNAMWSVGKKAFVWERPLSKTDVRQLSEADEPVPDGEIIAVRIAHVDLRPSIIADDPAIFFTVPHIANYAAVFARLDALAPAELPELLEEAWLVTAPKRVAQAYLASLPDSGDSAP